jgi:hypothetical protein
VGNPLSNNGSISSISTKYELDSIRPVAIEGIDGFRIGPVEKYTLAVKYAVGEWEDSSFWKLCSRRDPLTIMDARKLGVDVTTKVFTERERLYSPADERLYSPPDERIEIPFDWPPDYRSSSPDIILSLESVS